jgi:hypothetical protein
VQGKHVSTSLIYTNIHLYRAVMSVLYKGQYRARFDAITGLLGGGVRSVCDLCFGDTVVAEWCRSRGIDWVGVDLNPHFCARARRMGFRVLEGDLLAADLPRADVFVMTGSLYHFHDRLPPLFDAVFERTGRFIISEPIVNLSSQPGALGWIARRSANPGDRQAAFRYDEPTLAAAIDEHRHRYAFQVRTVARGRDLVLELSDARGPGWNRSC